MCLFTLLPSYMPFTDLPRYYHNFKKEEPQATKKGRTSSGIQHLPGSRFSPTKFKISKLSKNQQQRAFLNSIIYDICWSDGV